MSRFLLTILLLAFVLLQTACAGSPSPLPSWNDSPSKSALTSFVQRTTDKSSPDYIRPEDRIAVFDNDGTLWCEQPLYFQLIFAIDRIKALAPQHPEWNDKEPFKSILAGDTKAALASGAKGLEEILAVTHAGMTTDEFHATVSQWLQTARHPKYHRPYNQLVYQPMLEALAYLRANGYKTYIVSGGGVEFMRAFAAQTYGIPPEQIIGSSGKLKYELQNGAPVLIKLPQVNFVDDKEGKPIGIQQYIGKRPAIAFGNSDGDYQMLQWTTSAPGARLALIVHHTDAARETAYDRASHIGALDKALDQAPKSGWILIDMKYDWKTIFPPPPRIEE